MQMPQLEGIVVFAASETERQDLQQNAGILSFTAACRGLHDKCFSPHPQDRIPDMEGRKLDFSAASGTAANIFCQEGVTQN